MSATGRGRVREPDDYYTTPSWAVRRLLERWKPPTFGLLVEPSAGNGAIIQAAAAVGIEPWRWWAYEIREEEREKLAALCTPIIGDFLVDEPHGDLADDAVTAVIGNPPYSLAWEFIKESSRKFPGAEICFLLRLAFAASEERNAFMRDSTPDVYLLPNRPSFTGEGTDSADYAWFVWQPETRAAGKFVVLDNTPLAERKRDRAHAVMIEDPQKELFS